MKADDDGREIIIQATHRGQLRRIGGAHRRRFGTVHDGLESLSTLGGIRIPAVHVTLAQGGLIEDWDLGLDEHRRRPELFATNGRRLPKRVHTIIFSMLAARRRRKCSRPSAISPARSIGTRWCCIRMSRIRTCR